MLEPAAQPTLHAAAAPLPFAFMQHSLAAIRAGRSSTRYVSRRLRPDQPWLRLRQQAYVPAIASAATTARPGSAVKRPLDALRAAARGHVITATAAGATRAVRRTDHGRLSWSRPFETGLRRARPRSAAPWRA